ncbi:regakine-1-like [Halichoeres trimaculatus]|uniref:regakine-1-like n=1 Tax=Halichoeres trimaculatus TaxID=147232 RepID=UPI003D9E3498
MMMMKNPLILVTCVLLLSALTVLASDNTFGPAECCFKFVSRELPKRRVLRYERTDRLCPREAVLITMKNGSVYCANPDEQWVKNIMAAKGKAKAKGAN